MSSTGGLYAAYGSNMDPVQMLERCPHSPAAGTGWLNGWRLTFGGEELGWDGALAMVVPTPAARCSSRCTTSRPHDQAKLDYWEGADDGLYNKIKLRVSTLEGDVLAWIYVLDAYEGGLPSARYLGLIAEAAEGRRRPGRIRQRTARPALPVAGRVGVRPSRRERLARPERRGVSHADRERLLVDVEVPWCRSNGGGAGRRTPSRARAPGTSSRYQAKSSPPMLCAVSTPPPGRSAASDGCALHVDSRGGVDTGGTPAVVRRPRRPPRSG